MQEMNQQEMDSAFPKNDSYQMGEHDMYNQ